MEGAPRPAPAGLAVDDAARRLAALAHLLEALSRRSGGWLAHAERLEHKVALAEHLADDARAAAGLRRRASELDPDLPGAPAGATADLLGRLEACSSAREHLEAAYGAVKPAVADAAETLLEAADPLVELPTMTLLLVLRSDQRRHMADLPVLDEGRPVSGPLSVAGGEAPTVPPVPMADPPARDSYLTLADERPPLDDVVDALHAFLHASIAAGERAGRAHHDTGDAAAARRAAVHLRHAAVADRLLGDAGSRWGERPVGPPHDDPFAVAEVIAVQHPSTERVLRHLLSERG